MNENAQRAVLEKINEIDDRLKKQKREEKNNARKSQKRKNRSRALAPQARKDEKSLAPNPHENRHPSYPAIADGPRVPGRPLWLPEGSDLEKFPAEIAQAAEEIVVPAYQQLVVNANSGMERSMGASLVHLLWLEILDQFDIKSDYVKFDLNIGISVGRKSAIDDHIRLLETKLRVGQFMHRIEAYRRQFQPAPAPQTPPLPPSPDEIYIPILNETPSTRLAPPKKIQNPPCFRTGN
jgi:hypothetical protein